MDTGGGPANWVVYNGRLLGCLMFDDSVRPEAEEVVSRLHEDGMEQTVLLTGDREFAARKVQRQTGIDQVYFHLLPEEKLEHVKRLRQDAHVLAVGDGINDALAWQRRTWALPWEPWALMWPSRVPTSPL